MDSKILVKGTLPSLGGGREFKSNSLMVSVWGSGMLRSSNFKQEGDSPNFLHHFLEDERRRDF